MRRRQLVGGLVVGVAIAALVAACGSEGNANGVGGVPTTVVGRADGQVTVAPTAVYVTVTRATTATRTASATAVASPTR